MMELSSFTKIFAQERHMKEHTSKETKQTKPLRMGSLLKENFIKKKKELFSTDQFVGES